MTKWISKNLNKVRTTNPLVQNITNFVVMSSTANALLAIGASPVMAHAKNELEDMLKIADSLVVNIGTLDETWIPSMEEAVKIATDFKKPVVLDPVGAGATRLRTETALNLLKIGKITVLKGNLGEIGALLGRQGLTKGVESKEYNEELALKLSLDAALKFKTTVGITGPIDYVSDGNNTFVLKNGSPILKKVTGTGCMVSAIIGAFLGVANPIESTVSGITIFNVAAEKAYQEAPYPGSFLVKLYDQLYKIDEKTIEEVANVSKI